MVDEPGLPQWAVRMRDRLQESIDSLGLRRPVRVFEVDDAARLPDPARWRGHELWASYVPCKAVSDGTDWLRTDTGAPL